MRARVEARGALERAEELSRVLLGHKDIRVTLAIYTHATDDMQDAAVGAIAEAFS